LKGNRSVKKFVLGALAASALVISSVVPASAVEIDAPLGIDSIASVDDGVVTAPNATVFECLWWQVTDPPRYRKYCL